MTGAHVLTKAVVLAAGRGTRMRTDSAAVVLEPEQTRMADLGAKAMMPIHGRPFLAWTLSALADAGVRDVCVVVPPDDVHVREAFGGRGVTRLRVSFAVQHEPRGSADALLAAAPFTGADAFLLINADNLYPAAALALLHDLAGSGLVAFRRVGLLAGNITEARLAGYALVLAAHGELRDIVEKPSPETLRRAGAAALFSMTCWRFGPTIYGACRAIAPSARGELELPDAVRHLVHVCGERFAVVVADEPVLDMSVRDDVAVIAALLRDVPVRL